MSGQPVKNTSQENKFRNEYMSTLALQAEINDMNLQANKNYLMTGQLPAPSQIIDTRTTTEKLEDVEKLKQDIAGSLAPIADPAVAYDITNKILNSPLNVGNSLFRFLAQRIGAIVEELKKLYPYGISYEPTDIHSIVQYISTMYSEQQGKLQSIKSYLNSTQSTSHRNDVVSGDNIDPIIVGLKNISLKINRMGERVAPDFEKIFFRAIEVPLTLSRVLPTTDEIKKLNRLVLDEKVKDGFYDFFKQLELLPKVSHVNAVINKLDKYIYKGLIEELTQNELKNIIYALVNIEEMFSNVDMTIVVNQGLEIKDLVKQDKKNKSKIQHTDIESVPEIVPDIITNREGFSLDNLRAPTLDGFEESKDGYNPRIHTMDEEELRMSNDIHEKIDTLEKLEAKPRSDLNDRLIKRYNNMIEKLLDDYRTKFNRDYEHIVGVGIKPKKRRGRPRGAGIVKVDKPPNYVGFGINEINRKKLNEKSILTVRRNNSRTNIPDLPSRHVSDNFRNVLNTIVGGGVPKFNDMSRLTEEEQEYLYKLVSKSNLEDRLSVPAPSKDSIEKDFHEFEKMKGEILSGNDSKELVKKFKGLIMKLSRNGYLPKAEVSELLELLTSLSY